MTTQINLQEIRKQAEKYYAEGDYYCSESVIAAIRDHFNTDIPIEAVAMASGFSSGIGGSKCICGAISGGIMCLGYFFGRTKPKDAKVNKVLALSGELHRSFKANHNALCCGVLTKNMEPGSQERKQQCVRFVGEAAEKTAEIIARELNRKAGE